MSVVNPIPRALAYCIYTLAFFAVTAILGIVKGSPALVWCGVAGLLALLLAIMIDHPYTSYLVLGSYAAVMVSSLVIGNSVYAAAAVSGAALYLAAMKAVEKESGNMVRGEAKSFKSS